LREFFLNRAVRSHNAAHGSWEKCAGANDADDPF
jgi:hypothetical protein